MSKESLTLTAGRPSARANKSALLSSLSDKKPTKRVNFDLSAEQHTRLKIYAAQQGKSIKELLTELVEGLM